MTIWPRIDLLCRDRAWREAASVACRGQSRSRLAIALATFAGRLARMQKDLPAPAAQVLRDNLWLLYDETPPTTTIEVIKVARGETHG